MKMRILAAACLLFLGSFASRAQIGYIPHTAHPFAIGLSAGVVKLYGNDLKDYTPYRTAVKLNADYNFRYFVTIGAEFQYGKLEAAERSITSPARGLKAENNFIAGSINAKVSLGQFFYKQLTDARLRLLNGIYAGAGVGTILNNVSGTTEVYPANGKKIRLVKSQTSAITLPLNVGWNIELPNIGPLRSMSLNVNYQYSPALGDYLEGYNLLVGSNARGEDPANDKYSFISAGLRINFGKFK